jgi:hypothetical protein
MNIGIRLINFGIDSTAFLLVAFLIGFGVKDYISEDTFKIGMITCYYLYYFLFEYLTGKTLGKYITKTSVIDSSSGSQADVYKILMRTMLRMFPLDFLSYLFSNRGIHDYFSKTTLKYN